MRFTKERACLTRARSARCRNSHWEIALFALDSDAHTTSQLTYAETAIAHARVAGIPRERIVNCWTLDKLLAWISEPTDN